MAASRYVGRVGGLAVALGIGAALSVVQAGFASADAPGDTTAAAADRAPVSRSAATRNATGSGQSPRPQTNKRSPAMASRAALPTAPRQTARVSTAAALPAPVATARTIAPAASVGNTSGTPTPASDLPGWGILAGIRREFFNASPTITPVVYGQSTSASGQAVITGNIGAADADGDTLSYTYISTPQNGGTLTVDQSTGDFTYTAPSIMNALGGFDQFNVVVSDQTPVGSRPSTASSIWSPASR